MENSPLRSQVEKKVLEYVQEHYPEGVAAVYAKGDLIVIIIVANKYNPNNFW